MRESEVDAAFRILLEEIQAVVDGLNEEGASALKAGNYEAARNAIEDATKLAAFRENVKVLQREWQTLFEAARKPTRLVRKTNRSPLLRGLRTPEGAFRRPILEALVELGGEAPIDDVLALVEKKMERQLNEYDWQPIPSNSQVVRWRHTARWCRQVLVQEGLMRSDSPRGIWAISETGRKALQEGIV